MERKGIIKTIDENNPAQFLLFHLKAVDLLADGNLKEAQIAERNKKLVLNSISAVLPEAFVITETVPSPLLVTNVSPSAISLATNAGEFLSY